MWDALVDLVLPRRCAGCGRSSVALCPECGPAGPPRAIAVPGLQVRAAAEYGGAVRAAVLAYKERGRRDLARPLAVLLVTAVRALLAGGSGPVVLVPVPSGRAAAAARGGDHMRRLARPAATRLGLRVAPDVLGQARAVRDSAGLDVAARAANLDGALHARAPTPGLRGTGVVLVDDIVTTGVTLREAARALDHAGWTVAGAAVVAATPLRHPPAPLVLPRRSV